jgi:hypothetical protein
VQQYQYQVLVNVPIHLSVTASDQQSATDRAVAEVVRRHPSIQPSDIKSIVVYDRVC